MKTILSLVVCSLFATTIVFAQSSDALKIGSSIPMSNVKMKSVSGKDVSIQDEMKKNGVLVMFSCNTCPFVVKYQGRTQQTIREAAKRNIGVVIVNSNEEYRNEADSYDAMKSYAKKQGYTVPYLADAKSALADAFGATRTPECYLFNGAGKLIYHGAIDDNQDVTKVGRKHLFTAISESLEGKDIAMKETRSIGCMIKRAE